MAQLLDPVRLATTEYLNLSTNLSIGNSKIDGVIVTSGIRILVKAQTDKRQNGIYVVQSSGALVRSSDFANGASIQNDSAVFVQEGITFQNTGWVVNIATDSAATSLVVGTDSIEFFRFSVNLNIANNDIPSALVLREVKGYPLTIAELDNNFKWLGTSLSSKVNTSDYTASVITSKINSLTAEQANLNAFKLQNLLPSEASNPSTIVLRDSNSNIYVSKVYGSLIGNASTATSASYATVSNNVDGVVSVLNGGTGSNSPAGARTALGAVNIAGDTLSGKLVFAQGKNTGASINIPIAVASPSAPVEGDIWVSSSNIKYYLGGKTQTVAPLDSPSFTGGPTAPTADKVSNSTAIATTAFVQLQVADINSALELKANINSPTLTGTPSSTTPSKNDRTTRIATTSYVKTEVEDYLLNYYTKTQIDSNLTNGLSNYYTKTQSDSNLTAALGSYYTKTQSDLNLSSYYTKTQTDTQIANAISVKANISYVDGLQDKWGTSRKFVQSTEPTNAVDGDIWFKV